MRWSNSSLYTAQQCGERFRRRYLERDFRPSGIRAKRGTAVHKVANVAHSRQLAAKTQGAQRAEYLVGALPTDEEARDLAADSFNQAVAQGVAYTPEEVAVGVAKVAGEEKDLAVRMSSHYLATSAPLIDPVGVERKVVIRLPGMDDEITGIVDLISEEWRAPEPDVFPTRIETVDDLKTANKLPRPNDAVRSQQLALYALIRSAETKRLPDRLRLRVLTQTRTGKISTTELSTVPQAQELDAVAQRLNAVMEAVRSGTFIPANPDSWWCSAKYCEYHGDCKFALGRTAPEEEDA